MCVLLIMACSACSAMNGMLAALMVGSGHYFAGALNAACLLLTCVMAQIVGAKECEK